MAEQVIGGLQNWKNKYVPSVIQKLLKRVEELDIFR